MRLEAARRYATHAAVGFAFASTLSGGDIPVPVIALFVGAWSAALVAPGHFLRFARLFTWLTGAALVALAGLWLGGLLDLVVAASLFTIALAANRLLCRQSAADDGLLHLSALLMLAGGAALSADLAYGICFAGFALAITAALTLSHLCRAVEEAGAAAAVGDRSVPGRLMGALLGLSAVALAGSIVVFFLFPRITAGLYARPRTAERSAGVGFSEQLRLGGHGTLKTDARAALHVRFKRDPGADALAVYWRGLAYDAFDGRAWSTNVPAGRASMSLGVGAEVDDVLSLEVEVLEAAGTNTVFQLGRVIRLSQVRRSPARRGAPPLWLVPDAAGNVRVRPRPEEGFGYELAVVPEPDEAELKGLGSEYPEEISARYLQLPEGLDPRVTALARRVTAGLGDPFQKVKAIERELSTRYAYSRELPGELADPLAHFLFERREGHCEFFSTAMTVMLRAAGVPARNVTGFFGGTRGGDGRYTVRVGDAHSWSEAWFPGMGFVPFDPTPPEGRTGEPSLLVAWLVDLHDRASDWWRLHVVELTFWDQVRASRSVLGAVLGGLERLRGRSGAGASPTLRVVLALAVVAGSLVLARRLWRVGPPWPGRGRSRDPSLRVYRALLRRLAQRGFVKAPGQTQRELAAAVLAAGDPSAAAVASITERCLAARFGGLPLTPDEFEQLRALVRTI